MIPQMIRSGMTFAPAATAAVGGVAVASVVTPTAVLPLLRTAAVPNLRHGIRRLPNRRDPSFQGFWLCSWLLDLLYRVKIFLNSRLLEVSVCGYRYRLFF